MARTANSSDPAELEAFAPARKPLIEGVLPERLLAMVYGRTGSGKSAIVLDMAIAIVNGRPSRGHSVQRGGVLWLAVEGAEDAGPRLGPGVPSCVLAATANSFGGPYGQTSLVEHAKELCAVLAPEQPGLIVLDTLARATVGRNESAAQDMTPVLDAANNLREITGACVLLIHHAGWDARHSRGFSGLIDWPDTVLRVTARDGVVDVIAEKQRASSSGKRIATMALIPHDGAVVVAPPSSVELGRCARALVLALGVGS